MSGLREPLGPHKRGLNAHAQFAVVDLAFGDEVIRARRIGLDAVVDRVEGREEEDGHLAEPGVSPHLLADLIAIHIGHHNVQDDEIGDLPEGCLDPLAPRGRFRDLVTPAAQHDGVHHAGVVIVLDNQDV